MRSIQPSLRDLCNAEFNPALKRRAIFITSLRDKSSPRIPKSLAPYLSDPASKLAGMFEPHTIDELPTVHRLATPSILARFYSDYSSSFLPQGDIFKNVLEEKYGVPKNRVDEAINLILANARYAKLLQEQPDGKLKLLSSNVAVGVGAEVDQKPASSEGTGSETPTTMSGNEVSTEFTKACFVITPIGEEGSNERKHADAMLRHLITPVLELFGITPIRADKIGKPGHMTNRWSSILLFPNSA